jgi:hypothetical protein
MSTAPLQHAFEQRQQDGARLAGGLTDLCQRAAVYRHLFLASGGNHAFPLIAAHGALWAGGYFRFGMGLGRFFSRLSVRGGQATERIDQLTAFANVFRDINRRVCVDTYANFHFTRLYGRRPEAANFVAPELLEQLNRVHAAAAAGIRLTDAEKRQVFETHFFNEQQHVVGPTLERAVEQFDWPLMKSIALRPLIRFAYFPTGQSLWFRNFASRDERIAKGLRAFEIAARVGWDTVDAALERYGVLPQEYFVTPAPWFERLRASILATA